MTAPDQAVRRRSFHSLLVNTFIANLTTSFLWSAVLFWMYLETRSVLVTSIFGGAYMFAFAVMGVPFGTWIDRTRKKHVMTVAQLVSTTLFVAAFALFLLVPSSEITSIGSPAFVGFLTLLLVGAVTEAARGIALSTCVTLLIDADERDKANGLVGIVVGLSFSVTSVFAGLAIGFLGIIWSMIIAVALSLASLAHLTTVRIPEPVIVHADGVPQAVDFRGAWNTILAVPGLVWLILFSTFNNLLGGVFMALMDPYGLELVSVEFWGILWGVLGFGFILGGAWVSRYGLGSRPVRSLLLANLVMWAICVGFTIRENIWLTAAGILAYMALIPVAEAAEQTVMQRVVPFEKQGRVFGFAQSVEVAAAPVSAFLIGPVAEFWLIPYAGSDAGRAGLGWLLGEGNARGIALVFVVAGLLGLVLTVVALLSPPFRHLSDAYAAASPSPTDTGPSDSAPVSPEPGTLEP